MGRFPLSSRTLRSRWPRAWKRHPLGAAVLLLLTLLIAWQRFRDSSGADFDRYHNRVVQCVRGVDGDTIDVDVPDGSSNHTRIRLWGVDTPESAKSEGGPMYYGPEASAFTASLVTGQPVRLVLAPQRTRDRYGRLLAYVYVSPGRDERMLNEVLVAEGYAYADRRFDHVWRQRFEQLEERAERDGAGLWTKVRIDQMPPWRQKWLDSHR